MYLYWRIACHFSLSAPTHINSMHHLYKFCIFKQFSGLFLMLTTLGMPDRNLPIASAHTTCSPLSPYPPDGKHRVTAWCPHCLPPHAWPLWGGSSHLPPSQRDLVTVCVPLVTLSAHLVKPFSAHIYSYSTTYNHPLCKENLFIIGPLVLQANAQVLLQSSEGVTGNSYANYAPVQIGY